MVVEINPARGCLEAIREELLKFSQVDLDRFERMLRVMADTAYPYFIAQTKRPVLIKDEWNTGIVFSHSGEALLVRTIAGRDQFAWFDGAIWINTKIFHSGGGGRSNARIEVISVERQVA